MSWASTALERLQRGETITIRPRGRSMTGKVNDGDRVTVEPATGRELSVGDIVLVRVHGHVYLHLIKAKQGERLLIGKFCAIAAGARFVMAAANHLSCGPTTFPFTIFPGRWQDETLETFQTRFASKGDTVVGNDVWFGRDVIVMPGVTIGDGAIIATAAVVTRDVAPYTVVGGNPAQLIKHRYPDAEVALLQRAAWWDWPIEIISAHATTLMAGTPAEIAEIADQHAQPPGVDPRGEMDPWA